MATKPTPRKPAQIVHGEYHRDGYTVFLNNNPVYTGGNSHQDSTAIVSRSEGVSLDDLRKFCRKTTKEITEERHATYGGIERVDEPEN